MTAQEIGKALTSGEATLIISGVLILGLWLLRHVKNLEKLSTKEELIAILSALLGVVALQLAAGASAREVIVQGIVSVLASLKFNSAELPAGQQLKKKPK